MRLLHPSIVCFATATAFAAASDSPMVQTRQGSITGTSCASSAANGFLGIPFAQPPIGNLRFASPVPYNGTYPGGHLNATQPGASCPQVSSLVGTPISPVSEDCSTSPLPVKVFIYGGSFQLGANSQPLYDGCNLATDALVVTVNYRLGGLGWLSLNSAGIAGNMGLEDAILGTQWVQDNIAAFGGDPKKVLVFGESAGAGIAWVMSTLPNAPSLMNAAIAESGAGVQLADSSYQIWGQAYARALNCSTSDYPTVLIDALYQTSIGLTDDQINCLRSKSWTELVLATPATSDVSALPAVDQKFNLVVDGNLVATQPALQPAKVPLLAGTNGMEGTLFALEKYSSPTNLTATALNTYVNQTYGTFAQKILEFYSLDQYGNASTAPFYAYSQIYTDSGFKCSNRFALNMTRNAGVNAYTYEDNHTPTCGWNSLIPLSLQQSLGPTHSSELYTVFGLLNNLTYLPNGSCNASPSEHTISSVLTRAWTSMAAAGKPGSADLQGTTWPQWSLNTSTGLLIGQDNTTVGPINYTACDQIWDELLFLQLKNSSSNASNSTNSSTPTTPSATPSSVPTTNAGVSSNWVMESVGLLVLSWVCLLALEGL